MKDIGRKVGFGVVWTVLAQSLRIGASIILLPILTHLLTPEEFGLVGMCLPIIFFLFIFNDMGIGQALIRDENPSLALWSTAMWTNLAIGACLTMVVYFSADLVALAYNEPDVAPLLKVLSLAMLLHCGSIVPNAWLVRQMKFGGASAVFVGSQVFASIGAVIAAYYGAGAWSIIIQQLLTHGLKLIGMWAVARPHISFVYSYKEIKPVLAFSVNLLGAEIGNFFARNSDNMLIGRFLGAAALGHYAVAYQLMIVPVQAMGNAMNNTLLPAFSNLRGDPDRLISASKKSFRSLALVAFPVMFGLSAVSEPLIDFALDDDFAAVSTVVAILAPVGALQIVTAFRGSLLMALGKANLLFWLSTVLNIISVIGFAIGLRWGLVGVAGVYAFLNFTLMAPSMKIALMQAGIPLRTFLMTITPSAAIASVMYVAVVSLQRAIEAQGLSDLAQLLICVPFGAILYGAGAYVFERGATLEILALARKMTRRGAPDPQPAE